jgi:hypothetical protein
MDFAAVPKMMLVLGQSEAKSDTGQGK